MALGCVLFPLFPSRVQAATTNVTFNNFSFVPSSVTIHVGDTVTFKNAGGFHTVTGDGDDKFCGSDIIPLECSHTFTVAGTFPYHCIPHVSFGMVGTVIVLPPPNVAPTLSVSSPAGGAVYLPGTAVSLTATAADTDGQVTNVQVILDGNTIGNLTSPPYTLPFPDLALGSHSATVRAFDNAGAVTSVSNIVFNLAAHSAYRQTNLVSDLPGVAAHVDPQLKNPWAIAVNPTGPFWISDNHTGLSTLYNTAGELQALVVTIPPAQGANPPSAPTGMIFNNTKDFVLTNGKPANFIFSGEDGTITAWNGGTNAELKADLHTDSAILKGLAIGSVNGSNFLYAPDFHNGVVRVFDSTYAVANWAGAFQDPNIPAGFAPFGIQNVNGSLVVAYAKQDADREDDDQGPGNGYVDVFATDGTLIRRLASNGVLNSPWGIVKAPKGFGIFSEKLLIGNFGDGLIHAFDFDTGAWAGTVSDESGTPLRNPGLWGIMFGNGGRGGSLAHLYFTAGIPGDGKLEDHGLLGGIEVFAPLQISETSIQENQLTLAWVGGTGPFRVEQKSSVADGTWVEVQTTPGRRLTLPFSGGAAFFRVSETQ